MIESATSPSPYENFYSSLHVASVEHPMKRQILGLQPIRAEQIRRLGGSKRNSSRRNQDAELTTIKPLPFTIIECRAAIQLK